MNTSLHRFAAVGAVLALGACAGPTPSEGSGQSTAPVSNPDSTHPWVMQQTSASDYALPQGIQPLYGAIAASASPRRIASPPIAATIRPSREIFGFAFGNSSLGDPTYGYPAWSFDLLTTIAYFGLSTAWDGTIVKSGSGWTTWNSAALTGMVNAAHAHNVRVILSANLHDFSASSTSTMCAALHPIHRATTVNAFAAEVARMHVDGVNLDYEGTNATCSGGYTTQAGMTALAQEFRAKMPSSYIAVDTYSGSASANTGYFNIPALNPYVNSFFVMAYDM